MVNLFAADPRRYKLSIQGENRRVLDKNKDEPSFFTVGRVTSSSLHDGLFCREINVQPLARTWPRQHAMLAQMLQMNNLLVASYKDGIQYSTARKPASGSFYYFYYQTVLTHLLQAVKKFGRKIFL